MTIQKYDWVSKDTKLNANGWRFITEICKNRSFLTCTWHHFADV